MGHDFDFCDSYLIPKDQKQVSFTVQSNRVPLIFCVLLYMHKTYTILNFMTHIQFQKQIKSKFLSLFEIIVYRWFCTILFNVHKTHTILISSWLIFNFKKKKKKNQISFTVQNNRVLLTFYVPLKIPSKSEKKKKIKSKFLSLFKKIIVYLSFFFFFLRSILHARKTDTKKKKNKEKTVEDRCYRFQKPFYPRTEWERFWPLLPLFPPVLSQYTVV